MNQTYIDTVRLLLAIDAAPARAASAQWKLMNLAKLKKSNAKRFAAQHQMLAERFEEDAT